MIPARSQSISPPKRRRSVGVDVCHLIARFDFVARKGFFIEYARYFLAVYGR